MEWMQHYSIFILVQCIMQIISYQEYFLQHVVIVICTVDCNMTLTASLEIKTKTAFSGLKTNCKTDSISEIII